jgi:hypothetical protein
MNWLLFLSKLPSNPSSLRVTVWRKMRSQGAMGLQNGVWMLPDEAEHLNFLQDLSSMIMKQGAASQILRVSPISENGDQEFLKRFVDDRAEEYGELKEQCEDFLNELSKETQRENFSYAEYEENEQDLGKLENWLEKIRKRDFLGGDLAQEAAAWLDECREKLSDFANRVIASEDGTREFKLRADSGQAGSK